MRNLIVLSLLAVGSVLGCHKKEVASPPQPAPAAENSAPFATPPQDSATTAATAPTPVRPLPPPPLVITANADNNVRQRVDGEVDGFLTGQLRAFVQQNGRVPQSFYEFSLKSLDSMPRPPEGKRWVIDAADMQVKAVPAR